MVADPRGAAGAAVPGSSGSGEADACAGSGAAVGLGEAGASVGVDDGDGAAVGEGSAVGLTAALAVPAPTGAAAPAPPPDSAHTEPPTNSSAASPAGTASRGRSNPRRSSAPCSVIAAPPDPRRAHCAGGRADRSGGRGHSSGSFYAAKNAQAGFVDILSKRLRPRGVRVISLYPPDFDNPDPLAEDWETTPRHARAPLTAQSLVECVLFAVSQPRDCFIKAFHFEQV
ncbi:hypothetical protein [Kitasatospora aureofaciens]|uniref:hypothetical protein n=1 Tax=Kitasatospora aureofaciens TaxID=1894 RepID=UPI0037CB7852